MALGSKLVGLSAARSGARGSKAFCSVAYFANVPPSLVLLSFWVSA
jgi:hypothetical protein